MVFYRSVTWGRNWLSIVTYVGSGNRRKQSEIDHTPVVVPLVKTVVVT